MGSQTYTQQQLDDAITEARNELIEGIKSHYTNLYGNIFIPSKDSWWVEQQK